MKVIPPRTHLEQEARRGFRGYPVGTVAWYGPAATRATKVAVALVPAAGAEPVALERWVATQGDARNDGLIGQHVLALLAARRARTVAHSPGIIGRPREGGVDDADGGECPQCPYWHGRDRWARSGA